MLVPIMVCGGQFVVNTKGNSKGGHCQKDQCYREGETDFGTMECVRVGGGFEHR